MVATHPAAHAGACTACGAAVTCAATHVLRAVVQSGEHTRAVHRRVRYVPEMPQRDLWALLSNADVVLDTFPVGMGSTALETLALGVPVVTLPSRCVMCVVLRLALFSPLPPPPFYPITVKRRGTSLLQRCGALG